jgi:hypothetical protein
MKIKVMIFVLFLTIFAGCEEQHKIVENFESTDADSLIAQVQLNHSNKKIIRFVDQLYDPNTPKDVRTEILCKAYPDEYKKNYMPALLRLSPKENMKSELLNDLESALEYYKIHLKIKC